MPACGVGNITLIYTTVEVCDWALFRPSCIVKNRPLVNNKLKTNVDHRFIYSSMIFMKHYFVHCHYIMYIAGHNNFRCYTRLIL